MGIVASVFTPVGVAAILVVAACVLAITLRRWYVGVAFAVAVDVLTWSWVSWLKTAGNVAYWGAVLGVGIAFVLLASRSTVARVWLASLAVPMLLLAATSAWSVAPHTTVKESIVFAAVLVVAGFAAVNLQLAPHDADDAVRALSPVVVGVLVLTLAVIVVKHSQAVAQGGGVSGFINGANALGVVFALTLPFFLAHRVVVSKVVVLGVTMGILGFVVTLSGSRTGFVGLMLGFVAFELGRRQWRRLGVGIVVAAAAAGLAIVWTPGVPTLGAPVTPFAAPPPPGTPHQSSQLLGEGRPHDQSLFSSMVGARDEGWKEGLRLLSKRPVVGNGFGTGSLLFDHYGSRPRFHYFVGAFASGVNVHDSYIQQLDELGIVGGVLFLTPLIVALAFVADRLRRGWASTSEAAFGSVVVAVAFCAIFESILAEFGPMTLIAWLATGALGAMTLTRRRSSREPLAAMSSDTDPRSVDMNSPAIGAEKTH